MLSTLKSHADRLERRVKMLTHEVDDLAKELEKKTIYKDDTARALESVEWAIEKIQSKNTE